MVEDQAQKVIPSQSPRIMKQRTKDLKNKNKTQVVQREGRDEEEQEDEEGQLEEEEEIVTSPPLFNRRVEMNESLRFAEMMKMAEFEKHNNRSNTSSKLTPSYLHIDAKL